MCSLFSHTLTNVSFLCLTFCPSKVSNSNGDNRNCRHLALNTKSISITKQIRKGTEKTNLRDDSLIMMSVFIGVLIKKINIKTSYI